MVGVANNQSVILSLASISSRETFLVSMKKYRTTKNWTIIMAQPKANEEEIGSLTGPFGNSTQQNRVSGLDPKDAISRPGDRRP